MLNNLLKFIRRKAIADCQNILNQYQGYDTSFIVAKMSDLKLLPLDAETQNLITKYKRNLENENSERS